MPSSKAVRRILFAMARGNGLPGAIRAMEVDRNLRRTLSGERRSALVRPRPMAALQNGDTSAFSNRDRHAQAADA
jgi:hypothetical protein